MSTPESTPAPTNDQGGSLDDDAAQQALAAALEAGAGNADDDDEDEDDEEKFDAARARRKIEKANREARNLREQLKQLKPLADEAKKRREGEQTEAQRLAEQKAELEVQLAELRTTNTRREAAEAAGLPSKFVKFITAAEPDEALSQAKELAKALNAAESSPKADFRQGARGSNNSGSNQTADDLLRQMARQR